VYACARESVHLQVSRLNDGGDVLNGELRGDLAIVGLQLLSQDRIVGWAEPIHAYIIQRAHTLPLSHANIPLVQRVTHQSIQCWELAGASQPLG